MKCIVCGNSAKIKETDNSYRYLHDEFKEIFAENLSILYCEECKLFQLDIEDTEDNNKKLFSYYQKVYRNMGEEPDLSNKNCVFYQRAKSISKLVKKHYKGHALKIFEKGCGYGYNLMLLKKIYPDAALFTDEMDSYVEPYLKELGIEKGDENDRFDIIIVSHVLEHLLNPNEVLDWCYAHLNMGGVLYVEVPNSLNFIEPHVTFWTPESLKLFYCKYCSRKI